MIIFAIVAIAIVVCVMVIVIDKIREKEYREMESKVLEKLGFSNWFIIPPCDECVVVKSRQAVNKYDEIKFFKEHGEKLASAREVLKEKKKKADKLKKFLGENEYKSHSQYYKIEEQINEILSNADGYRISIRYTSPQGRISVNRTIILSLNDIIRLENNPFLLMSKGEYNKYLKEQQQELLTKKHHEYYERVNEIIDYANDNRENLFIKGSSERLDSLVAQLFDRTVNSIKKIKSIDSEEWGVIGNLINQIDDEIRKTVMDNQKILDYYNSDDFYKIKETCEVLMSTQREFNEYITEKVKSISRLFGTRVVRNETINDDEYQYIRPYKKAITPFHAEVSANVFASAENSPLNYVVKYFYTDKTMYPEQIQKLHLLVEELATLKEAKRIIENYKEEYQQYLCTVPGYIIEQDEAGFYSRLGFANVDESVLVVEYKFSYTSGGGMAKRTFTIPMTEENIVELIRLLEGKLTAGAFTKEQRALMTNKMRESIKKRDNFTCCNCKNSIFTEPNLLLEIDHIIPVSKGGYTVEDNLQTLCWKCNRAKSNKIS